LVGIIQYQLRKVVLTTPQEILMDKRVLDLMHLDPLQEVVLQQQLREH
jgi:hypothetical protein